MRRDRILVSAAYAALTLLLTYPLWLRAASHQLGGGVDPWLFIWTVAWDVHALTNAPLAIFDANIFHPEKNTLAFSEHLIGTVIFGAPVIWLTGNPVLAVNAIVLASIFLCGLGGYVLGRRVGLSRPAAFICGVVFAFTPPRFGRMTQLHLTTIHWVPFALAFLYGYLKDGRARDLRLAVLFLSLQALTSGHGAALVVLGGGLMIAHHLIVTRRLDLAKRARDFGVPGLLFLLPLVAVSIPYLRARREAGLVRQLDDVGVNAVSWLSTGSRVDRWLIDKLPDWPWLTQFPDVALFPGVLAIALAIAGLARRRSPAPVWFFAVMLLFTVWMAIGPPFGVWQWIYWMPGLSFIRVPSRFMLLGMLALAVLAASGFERIFTRRRAGAAALCTVLLCAEFAMPIDVRPYTITPAAIDTWLASRPKPFSAVEIPIPRSSLDALVARSHMVYMLHSMEHFQPIVQGYSGIEPPGFRERIHKLMLFPDEAGAALLSDLGVDYAVVHNDYFAPELREYAAAGFARLVRAGWLELVFEEGPGRVYAIRDPRRSSPAATAGSSTGR